MDFPGNGWVPLVADKTRGKFWAVPYASVELSSSQS